MTEEKYIATLDLSKEEGIKIEVQESGGLYVVFSHREFDGMRTNGHGEPHVSHYAYKCDAIKTISHGMALELVDWLLENASIAAVAAYAQGQKQLQEKQERAILKRLEKKYPKESK